MSASNTRLRRSFGPIAIAALTAVAADGVAQEREGPPASQHGAVTQQVNETTVTIEYDRPVARGRALFGELIEWDVVWTPGANRATWVEFSTAVTLQGVSLEAGRYGVWLVPHDREPWEVTLVREWDTHHSFYPYESEALEVTATPEAGAHVEALAFYFPEVGPYQTTLRLHWGETVLPLRIEVPR